MILKITQSQWDKNYKNKLFLKNKKIYRVIGGCTETIKAKKTIFKDRLEYNKLTKISYQDLLTKQKYQWVGHDLKIVYGDNLMGEFIRDYELLNEYIKKI
jgi:hypothetical protein|tara:strand:+ start:2011 stop:2310 length:300 start_codon:yes stop_codon:yes gene_type:complete